MKYSFIGGGNMAKAIISGMLESGIKSTDILVTTRTEESAKALEKQYCVYTSTDNNDARQADVIVLSVKPQVVFEILSELESDFFSDKLVISVMAGVTLEKLQSKLHHTSRVVRTMPNTPAFVRAGTTGLFGADNITDKDKVVSTSLFDAVGKCLWVETEQGIDWVNAISGSGPAYFLEFIKAVSLSGESLGLSKKDAVMLAVNTAKGAALLAEKQTETNPNLQVLIDQVTSKGGTTIEAINSFRKQDLDSLTDSAIKACYQKVLEMNKN